MPELALPERFEDSMRRLGIGPGPARLLVACSGGIDSTVLLHLLRFGPLHEEHTILAAHFDHGMRPASHLDAEWMSGLCTAWGVHLRSGRADLALRGEAAAREARYSFLRNTAAELDARWILTAHHADDQAETVLFRVLRGTGIAGLRGIPSRSGDLLRPLLPFWRREIEAYARASGLRWREDPTNRGTGAARNRLRSVIIPQLEREIAPGARRNLVSLAALARESEAAWGPLVERLLTESATSTPDGFSVDRGALRDAGAAVAGRTLRELLKRLGIVPDRAGTRSALQFITDAPSGRVLTLPSGVRISLEFDRAVVHRTAPGHPDRPLTLDRPVGGGAAGSLILGGRVYDVRLLDARSAGREGRGGGWSIALPSAIDFPITLRARMPGDRIRTRSGTRTLKRLMIDRKVPSSERPRLPVLVDARGVVLWVSGLVASSDLSDEGADLVLEVTPHEG